MDNKKNGMGTDHYRGISMFTGMKEPVIRRSLLKKSKQNKISNWAAIRENFLKVNLTLYGCKVN